VISYDRILCPIDFSDTSTRALTYAMAIAAWYQAELEVLHVVAPVHRPPSEVAAIGGDAGLEFHAVSRDEVLAEIRRFVQAAGGTTGFTMEPVTLEGRVHEVIVSRAEARSVDLLVMGTHGRSGFHRLLLGSVTEKVVRTARCPVLTVPPTARPLTKESAPLRKFLCPIDYSPSSLKALRYALEFGRLSGGEVTVLHALEYMEPDELCQHVDAGVRRSRQEIVDGARRRLHTQLMDEPRTWCEIREVVAIDRAYKEILRRAADGGADLIVMGAQGSGGMELMLYGSNTQNVVRAATCPVFTVQA